MGECLEVGVPACRLRRDGSPRSTGCGPSPSSRSSSSMPSNWAIGGYFGVDVFFVLSGYLITSLLLGEWQDTGGVALRSFWARRARRLLPALFLMLAVVGVVAVLLPQVLGSPGLWATPWPPSATSPTGTSWLPTPTTSTRWPTRRRYPHLVAGHRGAVLPGVAPGRAGPGRRPPSAPPRRRPDEGRAREAADRGRGGGGRAPSASRPPDGAHHPGGLALTRPASPR